MPLPNAYTEETLAAYMASPAVLGNTADLLGWTYDAGSYDELLNRVIELSGKEAVEAMNGREQVIKVRALARFAAWEAAVSGLVTEFDVSADGASMSREAIFQHAQQQLERARDEIIGLGYDPEGANTAEILTVNRDDDPYRPTKVVREYLTRFNP